MILFQETPNPMKTAQWFCQFILEKKPFTLLTLILSGIFLLRLPTLFVEYYDIDLLTSFLSAKNALAGLPFHENKGPLYHLILNASFKLFGLHGGSFHFAGIIIIALTSGFLYLLGKRMFSLRAGILAALLYGFLVSSFNRHFMAINGEMVYNLFFAASYYFFYRGFFEKKTAFYLPLALSLALAALTKFQGIWVFLSLLAFLIFVFPAFRFSDRARKRYYLILTAALVTLTALAVLDWQITQIVFSGKIRDSFTSLIQYATVQGFSWLFPIKLIHRAGMLMVYHAPLWIPALWVLIRFFKKPGQDLKRAYLSTLFLFLFATIFITGDRLYFHYFVQLYPALALMAAPEILKFLEQKRLQKTFFLTLIIPMAFVFFWNVKDALITRFYPRAFYEEPQALYYFRLIFFGQEKDYLLPQKAYVPVLDYLKHNARPDDRLLVWPVGAELTYFSGLNPAVLSFWHEYEAIRVIQAFRKGNPEPLKNFENQMISWIRQANPHYFADVSLAPTVYFKRYGNLSDNFPGVRIYLDQAFDPVGQWEGVRLWKKRENEKSR